MKDKQNLLCLYASWRLSGSVTGSDQSFPDIIVKACGTILSLKSSLLFKTVIFIGLLAFK